MQKAIINAYSPFRKSARSQAKTLERLRASEKAALYLSGSHSSGDCQSPMGIKWHKNSAFSFIDCNIQMRMGKINNFHIVHETAAKIKGFFFLRLTFCWFNICFFFLFWFSHFGRIRCFFLRWLFHAYFDHSRWLNEALNAITTMATTKRLCV